MCTAISIPMGDLYFGRSMDVEQSFGERVVLTPKAFPLNFRYLDATKEHYSILGTAAVIDGYPLYADAFNEKGLCAAGLLFPDNAHYSDERGADKKRLCPFELIPYILGTCSSVPEVRSALADVILVNTPFSKSVPLSPLHWIFADRSGAVVLEQTAGGANVYDDPYGVLANNPPFPYHTENIKRYANLSPDYNGDGPLGKEAPFGAGTCATGLDGDYSSPSRFVRAAFLLSASRIGEDADEQARAAHFFSILASVSPPRGAVIAQSGALHYTHYTCCMNAGQGIYYIRKYSELSVRSFELKKYDVSSSSLICCT